MPEFAYSYSNSAYNGLSSSPQSSCFAVLSRCFYQISAIKMLGGVLSGETSMRLFTVRRALGMRSNGT